MPLEAGRPALETGAPVAESTCNIQKVSCIFILNNYHLNPFI